MSQLKLTADSGGGTVAIKGPASTTGNAALDLTVPGTASATLDTLKRAGNILQVQSVTKTDTFTSSGTASWTDVTGLSVSITPSSSSNKILVLYDLSWNTGDAHATCRLLRDSTLIKVGDTASNRTRSTGNLNGTNTYDQYDIEQVAGTFMDSPSSTSSLTYKWQVATVHSSGYTVYVNRTPHDGDQNYNGRTASSITVMEVAA